MSRILKIRVARYMAWVFAVQMLVASLCMMPGNVMAQTQEVLPVSGAHCASDMQQQQHSDMADHKACAHCDSPDTLAQTKVYSIDLNVELSTPVLIVAVVNLFAPVISIDLALRPSTGPPRSASLIYSTTQRIRL